MYSVNFKKVLAIILAGGRGQRIEPLTMHRAKPAVPFGGIYRIVDFTLSNCLNSDLRRIIVLVQYKCRSLMKHLLEGWNIFSPALGEYLEIIPPMMWTGERWYQGTADAVYQNSFFVERENPEHVLILSGDHIYKMDYRLFTEYHKTKDADLTISAIEIWKEESENYGILQVDETSRVTNFQEKPKSNPFTISNNQAMCYASMGVYAFKTQALLEALHKDAQDKESEHDFGKNVIPSMIKNYKVMAYSFVDENKKEVKYWRDVGTIDSYYNANIDLVAVTPVFNLYDDEWKIRTYPLSAPPPKFVFAQDFPGGRMGVALDSIVSQGCIISGGRIQNSILSPFVRINSYAQVYDSILFENVQINRYAKIRKAIIDKDVVVPEGMEIGYDIEEDKKRFFLTDSGIVVISKGVVL